MPESPAPAHKVAPTKIIAAVLLALAAAGVLWLVLAPHGKPGRTFTGYVTAYDLYMSAPAPGTVTAVNVVRGERVKAGAPLFSIDATSPDARVDLAAATVRQAQAQASGAADDVGKAKAALASAEAQDAKAASDLARYEAAEREKPGAVAPQQIDQAKAAAVTAARQKDSAQQDIQGAQARLAAAQAQVISGQANLKDLRTQAGLLSASAPVAARVDDVMYQKGEWAAANAAIVALVPDDQVKTRFYVPQSLVSRFQPGTMVRIACDGCAAGMTAKVDYVEPRPEYTPPVIYSLKTRDKLVFLVEAAPSDPRALTPGQPIDVSAADGSVDGAAGP
ncbi:MAG TPA: HlyD family efflux transporter periplasmic adaptor subunit [Caulobacteraceae bacterium]|nr:HlyD family efflux transporter periplasmic adaptor subunit [Caulobacteraceae bacterium]